MRKILAFIGSLLFFIFLITLQFFMYDYGAAAYAPAAEDVLIETKIEVKKPKLYKTKEEELIPPEEYTQIKPTVIDVSETKADPVVEEAKSEDVVSNSKPKESTKDPELFYTSWAIYEYVSPQTFKGYGVFRWHGYKWTWYSERVLPGPGLRIPGRWSDTYFVRDGDGNICLASSDLAKGTYVMTPWGQGRIYDCGCAHGTIDVYVTW